MEVKAGKSLIHPFMNSTVLISLSDSVVETLRVMVQATTKIEKAFVEKNWQSPTDISVTLDLQSPPDKGQIRFHFTGEVLVVFCKRMLFEDVGPDSREALDCSGELSNMFFGFAKAKLNENGFNFKLSIPEPRKTRDLPVIESKISNVIIPFKVMNETCFIQIVVL